MTTRKITVINTSTQDDKTLEFDANHPCETLGQLKRELEKIGMSYADMRFEEANTKSTYEEDDSQLPREVNFVAEDGSTRVTNDLVFVLTKKDKKVASGASDRNEVIAAIKAAGLQDLIKQKEGKAYTNVGTDVLKQYLSKCKAPASKAAPATKTTCSCKNSIGGYSPVGEAIMIIASVLGNANILNTEGVVKIQELMESERSRVVASPYSEEEKKRLIARVSRNRQYNDDDEEEEDY